MTSNQERLFFLLAGTGVGVAMGMLFAPRSGHEIRENLAGQAHRGVERLSEKADQGRRYVRDHGGVGGAVRSMVGRNKGESEGTGGAGIRESVENVRDRFKESVEAGREEYERERERGVS